jgi:hypothetical protein
MRGRLLLAVLALALGACAGTPEVEVIRAERGVFAATEAGAREDARAALSLMLAERELGRARVLAEAHDVEGALAWARRAQADADVARLYAIEALTRGAAERTEDAARGLSRALDAPPVTRARRSSP